MREREEELREELARAHETELKTAVALATSQSIGGQLTLIFYGHALHKPTPRVAAGYAAIADDATPQSGWAQARAALGLSRQQAAAVSAIKLALWHWSQPVAYLFVFRVYFCQLAPDQIEFGMIVTARLAMGGKVI